MQSRKELTDDERLAVFHELLTVSNDMKLPYGALKTTASKFGVDWKTVKRIWKRRNVASASSEVPEAIRKGKKGKCGPKCLDVANIEEKLKKVPLTRRGTIRDCAEATGISRSTLFNAFKRGDIERESNTLKPYLTASNKRQRLEWALSFVNDESMPL